jgi:heterodisulfide reductase subunit C
MSSINFGYKVSADRQIDFGQSDPGLARYLEKREPSFSLCISCGTCAATCSAAMFTDFSLREMIIRIKRGNLIGIRLESEKCMLCGKCQLVCPRLVNTRNLILEIQRGCDNFNL